MRIGVPKEIKVLENRVGLVPGSVREAVAHGHEVIVEHNAGQGIGMDDDAYRKAGARVVGTAKEVFAAAEMIVKVKEPQAVERKMLSSGQILFTYLHLAPDPDQARELVDSGAVCIAYETVTSPTGGLPLLAPMSEVAGRMSIQAGAYYLEKPHGGLGMLLGGVPGVDPAKVVILGGGVVGSHAADIALGMGADVWVLDRNTEVLRALWRQFGRPLNTVFSTRDAIERHVAAADLVVGGVLIPGASAPKLVSHELVKRMKPGSVIVDVAIDQGGCFETSRPTTHADPVYVVDGVTHYCVANMPGGVPRTSTFALNNATLPFVLALADKGWKKALADDAHLKNGLNVAF
ncbi:MAG TPA: alanine dehydrogenase, partial [Casimicrobiaceae bacterium]|nr:alanine dehydrogenase [Casimicrobiaceae bacterium]